MREHSTQSVPLLRPLVEMIDTVIRAEVKRSPFQRDPATLRLTLPLIKAVNRYFGVEVRGWRNVPRDRPVLFVGNHSGGAETMDVAPLLEQWIDNRGAESPLYMLGYDLFFAYPIVGPLFRKLGLLRADPTLAKRALGRGASVVVFPGGDCEAFRSWSERNRIQFGGRMGFIELAIAAGVPVVPMTIHGAHESTIVLARGRRLARWMGLNQLNIKVFPFIWNIPFGPAPAFIPSVPLPAKITVQFGKPLDWSRYGPARATDPRVLQRCYDDITGVMQRTLTALAREHPYPVLTRLNELRPSQMLCRAVGASIDGTRRPTASKRRSRQREHHAA